MQIITDPWAAAEYLFSYLSKEAHMEKDLVKKLAGCGCSTLEEARKVLLKAGNAVLSHRQIGKVEAAWLILGNLAFRILFKFYLVKRHSIVSMFHIYCSSIYIFAMF